MPDERAMAGEKYVATEAIRDAVKGRETDVLDALKIDWRNGKPHIQCPYPNHADNNPSWRWDERRHRAYCSCIEKSHGIFDVVTAMLGLIFAAAKVYVAELLGRSDLVKVKTGGDGQKTDPASLLNPPAGDRDDGFVARYLSARLGFADPITAPMPTTKIVGWKSLSYYDPPAKKGGKPKSVGSMPCVVFETIAADGRRHAHRIYLNQSGDGKADLGIDAKGKKRNPKKSARLGPGQPSTAGLCVVWGNTEVAHIIIISEGIETAAAIAYAFRDEIAAGALAVMSAVTAGGIGAFAPWPNTTQITVAADRDEGKPGPGHKRGERAARKLGLRLLEERAQQNLMIALPGQPGSSTDFLDLLLASGPDCIRAAVLSAEPFQPTKDEIDEFRQRRTRKTELEQISQLYPLPALFNMTLECRHTDEKGIWLHKCVGEDSATGEPIWRPISSPFGAIVQLMRPGTQSSFGLRVHVHAPDGTTNTVDFLSGELFKLAASGIRSALADGGLRVANGGETDIVEILKQAEPTDCIVAAPAFGRHSRSGVFLDFEGKQHGK